MNKKDSKLSDNELNNVSGGYIFYAGNIAGSESKKPWEVIDNNNGRVLGRFENRDDAVRNARGYGSDPANDMEINWNQVRKLRGEI